MPDYSKISEIRKQRKKTFRHIGLLLCLAVVFNLSVGVFFFIKPTSMSLLLFITFIMTILPFLLYSGVRPLLKDITIKNVSLKDCIEWGAFTLFSAQLVGYLWFFMILFFFPSFSSPFFSGSLLSIYSGFQDPSYPITFFLLISFVGPIIEELIFRSILFNRLLKYGASFAILSSALSFSLLHLNIEQMAPTFLLGVIFAFAKLRHSLRLSIFLHSLNNAYVLLVAFFIPRSTILTLLCMFIFLILFGFIGIKFFKKNKSYLEEVWHQSPLRSKILKDFFFSPFIFLYILVCLYIIF